MLIQKLPHSVWITFASISLASNPYMPAMNCDNPPQKATKGKKIVGESGFPHQPAIQDDVIHVEPAKPASPRAAGGAIGLRNILTLGISDRVSSSFFVSSWRSAMVRQMQHVGLKMTAAVVELLHRPTAARTLVISI